MCIACKTKEIALDSAAHAIDLADALLDAYQLIERLKAKGTTLDAEEQKVYDRLSRYVRAEAAPAQDEQPGVTVQVVQVDSPDQLDAILQALQGRKPRSTH